MKKNVFLNSRIRTNAWEEYLYQAIPFDPLKIDEIASIVPIPDEKGVLIFSDGMVYQSKLNGLDVLNQLSSAQCFSEYKIMSDCIRSLGCFGQYKSPWVCPYFVLFPLESVSQTMWINPLSIRCLQLENDLYNAEMTDGPSLVLPLRREAFLKLAETSCIILAVLRRDLFQFEVKSNRPMDYINAYTPFYKNQMAVSTSLKRFPLKPGVFNRHYAKAYFLHHYDKLDSDPREIDWRSWL